MSALHTEWISWRGISIQVSYHPSRWNSPFDHVELQSENNVPLPITETGYRSSFVPTGTVTPDNLIEQVTAWLDEAAESKAWKKHEDASKQLSLF